MSKESFGTIDYVLFSLALGVSAIIGIYHALKAKHGAADFLVGSRKLPVFPTAVSLLTSFVSGISILSYPEEIYRMGTAFCWSLVGAILALIITGYVILPVMFRLEYMNLYQYFEDRFNSKLLRYYMNCLFILTTIFYLATALYVPCVALSVVTIIPTYGLILLTGAVCTLYTTIGGIKAVIWTDTFQGILMYAGIIALLVKGIMDLGSDHINLVLMKNSIRLDGLFNIDPDPFQYMTIWTAIFGGCFFWLGAFGANQIALQRYCSLPTLKKAQVAVALNVPGISLVFVLVFTIGVIMYAYFAGCDPGVSKDKLVMKYMLSVLHELDGLPGLFMAGVLSATLSSVSSGINSLTAVTWNDFILPLRPWAHRDVGGAWITKLVSACYGIAIVGVAFAVRPMGGALSALLSFLGALTGPNIGLLLFGLLVPWGEVLGAYVGVFVGSVCNIGLFVGRLIYQPDRAYALPISSECCNVTCDSTDLIQVMQNLTFYPPIRERTHKLFSVSALMLPLIGAMLTFIFGAMVSLLKRRSFQNVTKGQLVFWNLKLTGVPSSPLFNVDTDNFLEDAEHMHPMMNS